MDEPVLTHRLGRSRLWMGLGIVVTVVAGAAYALAWWRTPDRPWFALALLATVIIGWLIVRALRPRWHTAEVLAGRLQLRVRSLAGTETFDIAGATLLRREVVVTGWVFNGVVPLLSGSTEGERSDLVIGTPERSLVIHGRGGRRSALAELGDRLAELLDVEVAVEEGTRTRLSYRDYRDGDRPTVVLNPDLGSGRTSGVAGGTAAVVVGVLLLLGVPVAVAPPPYEDPVIGSPQPRIDRLAQQLASRGVDVAAAPAAGPATTRARWTDCSRENAWLWGESGGVKRLQVTARAEVAPDEVAAVEARLDQLLERRDRESGTDWRDEEMAQTIDLTDRGLEMTLSHGCLRPRHHDHAEAELSRLTGAWLAWLADTSRD